MIKHPIFTLYGLAVLFGVGWAEYRGLSLSPVAEVKGVPRTVRDNPGAYRPHYSGYSRYFGGK